MASNTHSGAAQGDRADLHRGLALAFATFAALAIANSPLAAYYADFLHLTAEVRVGQVGLAQSVEHWVNDGLMAIFFLLVGLEIKHEAREESLLVRTGHALKPWMTYGIAVLTGIGFTMSLFIGTLAFDDEALLTDIRIAVLAASVSTGLTAALVLRLAARPLAQG